MCREPKLFPKKVYQVPWVPSIPQIVYTEVLICRKNRWGRPKTILPNKGYIVKGKVNEGNHAWVYPKKLVEKHWKPHARSS
jgi:hypothetical protein